MSGPSHPQVYASAKAPETHRATYWHLSYNSAKDVPTRRTLCGKSIPADDERPIHTPDELAKLEDNTNRICSMCEKSIPPWLKTDETK